MSIPLITEKQIALVIRRGVQIKSWCQYETCPRQSSDLKYQIFKPRNGIITYTFKNELTTCFPFFFIVFFILLLLLLLSIK